MTDFAKEFNDLADRFLRLRGDDLPDKKGHRATRRAEGAGAQIVGRAVDSGRLPNLAESFSSPPNDAVRGPAYWANVWVGVVQWLQPQVPDRLPPDVGAFRVVARATTEDGKIKESRVMGPEDWKSRCEDWAKVCRVLADMVARDLGDEVPVVAPKPSNVGSLSKEEKALATLVAHPEWSDVTIADHVGCHRTSLYRWPRYTAAREALESGRQDIPRTDQL